MKKSSHLFSSINKTQQKILYLLLQSYPSGLLGTEIAKYISIHRSTALVNVNNLIKRGLVEKLVVKGTESHINPTLTFYLSQENKEKVNQYIDDLKRFSSNLFFGLEIANQKKETQDILLPDSSSFEDQVGELFIQVFEHLSLLQKEINQVRQQIDEINKEKEISRKYVPELQSIIDQFNFKN